MQAIWYSAGGCLSDQMEVSRLPLNLFSKNKCVLWPLNPPSPLHRAHSKKPLGKVRAPICACSMLSCSVSIPAEALQREEAIFPSQGEIVLLVAFHAQRLVASGKTCCPDWLKYFFPLGLSPAVQPFTFSSCLFLYIN